MKIALLATACMAGYIPCASAADAASYPQRPVRMIVAQAAGGNADIVARLIAQELHRSLGQLFVVDNRSGANGIVAAELTVRAPPDGHTILLTGSSFGVNPALFAKLPYDPLSDLAPVTMPGMAPGLLVVNPSVPVRSVQDLIELARAKPGVLNFGSSGNGSSPHLAGELFKSMTGVQMTHVPYKGAAAAMIDLMAGQVQLSFASMPSAIGHVNTGKLRPVAVTALTRSRAMPLVPTVAESGVPGYETTAWQGMLVPAKVAPAIVLLLQRETARIVNAPEIRQRLAADGAEPVGSTPQQFAAYLRADVAKWKKLASTISLTMQ